MFLDLREKEKGKSPKRFQLGYSSWSNKGQLNEVNMTSWNSLDKEIEFQLTRKCTGRHDVEWWRRRRQQWRQLCWRWWQRQQWWRQRRQRRNRSPKMPKTVHVGNLSTFTLWPRQRGSTDEARFDFYRMVPPVLTPQKIGILAITSRWERSIVGHPFVRTRGL